MSKASQLILLFSLNIYSQAINYEINQSDKKEIQTLPKYVKDSILYIALNPPVEKEKRRKKRNFLGQNEATFYIGPNNVEMTYSPNENFLAIGSGNSFDLGYDIKIGRRFSYHAGIAVDSYRASTILASSNTSYEYDINYIGIRNGININLITIAKKIELQLSPAIKLKYFSNGQQKINSEIYDISENSDFKGISLWGNIRFNIKFVLNKSFKIGVGYSISDNKTIYKNKNYDLLQRIIKRRQRIIIFTHKSKFLYVYVSYFC